MFMGLAAWLAAGAAGCGSDKDGSYLTAKKRAARTICEHAATCQLIGPGLTFETRADCDLVAAANVELLWPAERCGSSISQPELETCLGDIGGAACSSASDYFDELSKCQPGNVCTEEVESPR